MKYQVSYQSATSDCFYSVRQNQFFSYEEDASELHDKFGGKQYYESRTGLSGAGYLESLGDLIPFGWYRTDIRRDEQARRQVHSTPNGSPIFGYVPLKGHDGIDPDAPVVLTDGHQVVFSSPYQVLEFLKTWDSLEGKEYQVEYYDPRRWFDPKDSFRFTLINPGQYHGLRATRFVDLRDIRPEADIAPQTLFEQKLNIERIDSRWFHRNQDGYYDMMFLLDPSDLAETQPGSVLPEGWQDTGFVTWRRHGLQVEAFAECTRCTVGREHPDLPEYIDYEENFPLLDWFSRSVEDWENYFREKLTRKARIDYISACKWDGTSTKAILIKNAEDSLCIADSLEVGNCELGTRDFIQQYGLALDQSGCIRISNLLEHPYIEKICRHLAFQKVVGFKFAPPEEADNE